MTIFTFNGLMSYLNIEIFVPTPLVGGGTIYSTGFFVQTILADRYARRREM